MSPFGEKGQKLEEHASEWLHARPMVPLLLSSLVLRNLGSGQVDLASVSHDRIWLFEVKASTRLSGMQKRRLAKTGEFLAMVMGRPVVVGLLVPVTERFSVAKWRYFPLSF